MQKIGALFLYRNFKMENNFSKILISISFFLSLRLVNSQGKTIFNNALFNVFILFLLCGFLET